MKETDFCPTCRYYLYLNQTNSDKSDDEKEDVLRRVCRNCGYQEQDNKGGLVLEIDLREKTSEGYKILLNEFTKQDPTLPHVNTIKCPNEACKSNVGGVERDVIYIKYDVVNMKFLYICNVCDAQWRSKA